ncbi:OmpA family protein [Cytophagaceae bacterium ABcell3]|nr:OmpA family protein [Cytophagaceae bacterium ABcell3]
MLCCFNASAQSDYKAIKREAAELFEQEDYKDALVLYLELNDNEPGNPEYLAKIGISYTQTPEKLKGKDYLEEAWDLGYRDDGIEFYLGRAYHLHHEFEKAIDYYELSLSESKDLKDKAKREIERCKTGIALSGNPVEATIENIGPTINTSYPEYAPVISADEKVLIFTSRRPNSTGGLLDEKGDFYEDIYISYKEDGEWTTPINLPGEVNTETHDASIAFSADGQELLIYKNDTVHHEGGNIYFSSKKGKEWKQPEKLPDHINSEGWEPSASISAGEEYLFFSSDRDGGYGGTDIYVCKKQDNGEWGEAVNAGPEINTPYDEDAPFIHADGKTLYFSSKGHDGIGGFDIFTATFDKDSFKFSEPENIGYPINTADDELFFVWSPDGTKGYFSAIREDGHGDHDLYTVTRENVNVDLILFNGKITDEEDSLVPSSIKIIDNETNEVVAEYDSSKVKGDYTVMLEPGKNYGVYIESEGFLSHSENIDLPLHGFYNVRKDIGLTPLDSGGNIVLNNIFFESKSAELKEESFPELDRYWEQMEENPHLDFEISGHAYDFESKRKNKKLSEKRANAVADYLVEKGIEKKRLKPIGYGDKFPLVEDADELNNRNELIIIGNDRKDTAKSIPDRLGYYDYLISKGDSSFIDQRKEEFLKKKVETGEEKRERERRQVEAKKEALKKPVVVEGIVYDQNTGIRLEAKVILYDEDGETIEEMVTENDGAYRFEINPEKEGAYSVSAQKKDYGYIAEELEVPAISDKLQKVSMDLYLGKIEKGDIARISNIYFDFNQHELSKESYKELDKLAEFLKENPQVKIEVAGHTDDVGAASYNKVLSQRRCESVVNYLISKGIEKERLVAKGYGEEEPIAPRTEEGRAKNRRIEFIILEN